MTAFVKAALAAVLLNASIAQQCQADEQQHVRRFGNILHFAIMRGAPGIDVQKEVFGAVLAAMPDELEEIEQDQQAVQGFWPLNPSTAREELIWAERYHDLRDWTNAEFTAQRDPGWITNQVTLMQSGKLEFYSEAQVEDTLDDAPRLMGKPGDAPIAVHWLQLRSESILPNLVELPRHVRKLNRLLRDAGYTDIAVKYYGALTSAGSDRENASIWVEYRDLAMMTEALAFLTTDPAARGWRRALSDLTNVQREWYLLEAK